MNRMRMQNVFCIIYDIFNYGWSPYFVFKDELIDPFFHQGVKVSIVWEFQYMIPLITTSLFEKTEVVLNNYANKEHCHVSIKMW